MGINLAERLKAPTFDDEERTRVARVLHVVFLLLFGTMATIFVLRVALTGLDGHWFVYPLLLAVTLTLPPKPEPITT